MDSAHLIWFVTAVVAVIAGVILLTCARARRRVEQARLPAALFGGHRGWSIWLGAFYLLVGLFAAALAVVVPSS